ncbi:MAG: hypothetical protein C5B58_01325 [Acidobacteria bacterium]|nr:MAG: hypothetical protein C5B58_01325 [Acidobacteriota bacterium]
MPPRKHKGDYKMRAAAKKERGPTHSQERRRTKARKPPTKATLPIDDPRIEAAILEMNRGVSLTAAARTAHISRQRLRQFLTQHRLGRRKRRRWVTKDKRLRRLPVITQGRLRVLTVRGYEPARLAGEHHNAAAAFVRTNDISLIECFRGQSVQAVNGRHYVLETDPNALHRIAAMDTPPFHEIYEIISST